MFWFNDDGKATATTTILQCFQGGIFNHVNVQCDLESQVTRGAGLLTNMHAKNSILYSENCHQESRTMSYNGHNIPTHIISYCMPSVLWRRWLGGGKGIPSVITEWWGAGMAIFLVPAHPDKKVPSAGFLSWSWFLAVSLQATSVINPAVGCHYFPPGLQLPSQPLRGLFPILLLGEQRHNGCEQFA